MNKKSCNSLINGIATDHVHIDDRSIHYGDGLFETILCDNNKLYFWQQHFQRLQASSDRLKLACPDESVLLADISRLLTDRPSANSYVIKVILSRGIGERGYRFGENSNPTRTVLLSELEADYSSLLGNTLLEGELFICEQQVSINENLAGLKHLNRLDNVMARNEWHDKSGNIIDGLMLNADQQVIEGTMSNIFAVKEGQVFTPALHRSGVNGVMREVIVELAAKNNIPLSITDLSLETLLTSDEAFISNSLIGMKRVSRITEKKFKQHAITDRLFTELINVKEEYAQTV